VLLHVKAHYFTRFSLKHPFWVWSALVEAHVVSEAFVVAQQLSA
jgi:hypothetical protein